MINFACLIYKKYYKGCLNVIESAIKLEMSFMDILYILFCYNQAFKSPFLDKNEFYTYAKSKPFGDLMEELFIARDIINNKMNRELKEFEEHLSVWKEDSDRNANKNILKNY